VVVTGRYEELGEGSEFSAARAVVERSMQRRYMAWETPYQILHRREPGASGPAVFYSICVEDMTGLSATSEPFEPAAPF
jgi:nitroimidazol reductase NimA-like FMN-containing flavoprotein (pyridoxamine 5'-phosphate oxidase superfamily)